MTAVQQLRLRPKIPAAQRTDCAGCGSQDLTTFFKVDRLPVHVGMLHANREEALRAPAGKVSLAYCHECGLIHNQGFDPTLTCFAPGYEVGLNHSPLFRSFIEQVAQRLVTQYDLRQRKVFEIGCGDGYFLRRICELGANQGVGVDPTVAEDRCEPAGAGTIQMIRDVFGKRFVDLRCDFVCSLSVFEDIDQPRPFLDAVRRMVTPSRAAVYFEVFNAFSAFERGEVWSVHYEQCNYFSQDSLVGLFARSGFEILQSGACYEGDQYLFVEAEAATQAVDNHRPRLRQPLPRVIAEFSRKYEATKKTWHERLRSFREQGRRVVLWGSGGKGVSFLNALETQDVIPFVVEINPDKQGKFIPGSAQQIMPISFLGEYQPDTIIITNALYEREMKQQARELGVTAEFHVA